VPFCQLPYAASTPVGFLSWWGAYWRFFLTWENTMSEENNKPIRVVTQADEIRSWSVTFTFFLMFGVYLLFKLSSCIGG